MASYPPDQGRRAWLKAGVGVGATAMLAAVSIVPQQADAASLTKAQRDAMTPDQVIEMMRQGNERFRSGKRQEHDYLAQKRSSASGQFPAAVILSCIDSRAPAGAKVVLVMGHTACGAIAGAINNVELGHLTGLLNVIRPAVEATKYSGERSGNNPEFIDAVAKTNVQHTIQAIRKNSPVLASLEKEGKIKIVGSMYDLSNGVLNFLG